MTQKTLLTPSQRKTCQEKQSQPGTTGARAKALLAVDAGTTQADAANQSGLSLGQVRYCLRRFREVGMALFPATDSPAKTSSSATPSAKKKAKSSTTKTSSKNSKKNKGKNKKKDKGKKKDKKSDKPSSGKKKDKKGGKKKKKKK
ncbi:MAG: helix-turn-helix domain containing protein [Pseudomonadales bacterium]|nr:helix-turn-helix domain containing protein [Pseudomonadales bacterium]